MRIRRASWGNPIFPGWRGWAITLITRRYRVNFELQWERTNHQEDA